MKNDFKKVKEIKDLEKKLWDAADSLRGNLSSEEYMHVIIGILFLKQMSDLYMKAQQKIKEKYPTKYETRINDIDYLTLEGSNFIIPREGMWDYISKYASSEDIGMVLDNALKAIEEKNESLSGLFDKDYSRPSLNKAKLGEIITIFSNTNLEEYGEDVIGRVYEYFLGKFFLKQGQKGGEFYTPKTIVLLMVNIINPTSGIVYDPACGSGGMFIQSKHYLVENELDPNQIIVYGQEFNEKTWKIARVNLLLQGFPNGNIHLGSHAEDTFGNDLHKGIKADFVLANPPFNMKKYTNNNDSSWPWGKPPEKNANYAWLQIIIEKLNSTGKAAVVLANGSLTSSLKEEKNIRKNFLEENLVSAIISLPDKLFYTTQIPATIWIFDKAKKSDQVLFIDATGFGELVKGSKKNKEIKSTNIQKIKDIYANFENGISINEQGIAKTISVNKIIENDYSLLPGLYIDLKEEEKRSKEEIKSELKTNIEELLKLMNESKDLEKNLIESIKKLDLDKN